MPHVKPVDAARAAAPLGLLAPTEQPDPSSIKKNSDLVPFIRQLQDALGSCNDDKDAMRAYLEKS